MPVAPHIPEDGGTDHPLPCHASRVLTDTKGAAPFSRPVLIDRLCDWLFRRRFGPGREEPPEWRPPLRPVSIPQTSRIPIRRRLDAMITTTSEESLLPANTDDSAWVPDTQEHNEGRLQAWANERRLWCGPVTIPTHTMSFHGGAPTAEDWHRMDVHLDHLTELLLEVSRHGRDHWTEAQRRLYEHQPDESRTQGGDHPPVDTQQMISQDQLLCTPQQGYLEECSRNLIHLVHDPLVLDGSAERTVGESQLRPRTLYPS